MLLEHFLDNTWSISGHSHLSRGNVGAIKDHVYLQKWEMLESLVKI